MKILISSHQFVNPSHPHAFKLAHRRAIQKIAGKKAVIAVAAKKDKFLKEAADVDIIAGFPSAIPPLGSAKKLKWLNLFSAGADRILTPEVKKSPIVITNSSGIHATPIAEHVIGFILMFARGFHRSLRNQLRHRWQKDETITELRDKTVFVVGLGNIGTEVARLAHAFGARVNAATQTKRKKPAFVDVLKTPAVLDVMLPQADFVVICLPHTKETHHLFDMKKFKRMKQTAALINIGRGGIVNEKELIQALRRKIIGGAALDVTEQEPLPVSSPLWKMENVVITPHHSGLSEKYMDRAVELFCKNLKLFLKRKPLFNVVDKERGY